MDECSRCCFLQAAHVEQQMQHRPLFFLWDFFHLKPELKSVRMMPGLFWGG